MAGLELVPANLLHADTITCLRNSGAKYRERRDNAILARPGRTEARPGAGNEAADAVDAANELTARTEHLCRVRKAHRVSLRDSRRVLARLFYFQRIDTSERCRRLYSTITIFSLAYERTDVSKKEMSCGFPVLRLKLYDANL